MTEQKKLIKIGLFSERAHRLAFDIAIQAGRLGNNGIAVIADETRNIGLKLHKAFDESEGGEMEKILLDAVLQLKHLAVNGCLEMMRESDYQDHFKPTMPLAVTLDEIITLTHELEAFYGRKSALPHVIPKIAERNPVLVGRLQCVSFRVNGSCFSESSRYVQEVLYYNEGSGVQTENGKLKLRGKEIPLLSPVELGGKAAKHETALIVTAGQEGEGKRFALPVDELPEFFVSEIGRSAVYSGALPSKLVRESWNCEEGRQMVFLNYENIKRA